MSFLQTVEADLAAAGGWLETEAETFAIDAWGGIKTLFTNVQAQQVTIVKSLVAQAEQDETSGMGVEATVADVLTLAENKELTWVASLPNQALIGLVTLFKTKFG